MKANHPPRVGRGLARVLVSSAVAAALASSAALAQQQDQEDLMEVTVTAQKREQSLQDVPISMTVVDGAELANRSIKGFEDFSTLVPNFNVVRTPGAQAIFMRGIPVVQIPTTLLAQVDAAVGGKTGANLVSGKNLIGAFHQPLAVLIDPDVTATLPDREYRAGLYEIIKCGVIRDRALFGVFETERDRIAERAHDVLEHIIAAAVRIKAEVVSEDERESDLRRILNFGHTIGHTLEAETSYVRFLHGEAVAFGMIAAAKLAVTAAGFPEAECARLCGLVNSYGPIPSLDGIRSQRLFARLASDKKTLKGKVHFVLPTEIGVVKVISGVAEEAVLEAIEWALNNCATA